MEEGTSLQIPQPPEGKQENTAMNSAVCPGRGEGRTWHIAGALSQATQASKREMGESTSILWVES